MTARAGRGVPLKTLLTWHAAQGCVACTPTSAKNDVWLNVPSCQVASVALWHDSQVVGNPAAVWLGLLVFW